MVIKARFRSRCTGCSTSVPKGNQIFYIRASKTVFCLDCMEQESGWDRERQAIQNIEAEQERLMYSNSFREYESISDDPRRFD